MSKITISEMSYHYIAYYHPIFERINVVLDTNWKLGLIGRNGRGKTTLLKLIQGELQPDSGKIVKAIEADYFPYPYNAHYSKTLDVIKENIGNLKSMEDEMEAIIADNDEARFNVYHDLLEKYMAAGGFEMEGQIRKELKSMGLDETILERDFTTLSGGEQTKVLIIALFLRKNRFILLDEPTNHLDEAGRTILASYLKAKKGFIVVSHDRVFLDQVIDHVLAINKSDITLEQGNYTSWKQNKDFKEEFERRTQKRLEHEISQLERRSRKNRGWARGGNTQKYAFACHARANGAKSYMHQAKRSEEQIRNHIEEKKKLLQNFEQVKSLVMGESINEADYLLKVEDLSFAYEDESRKILDKFNLKVYAGDRIWIKGKNGAGKSTLLRLLGQELMTSAITYAEGITMSKAYQQPLWKSGFIKDLVESKDLERFLELCECFDLPEDFLERPLETYSSGELKKVDIARALAKEYSIILLDEPLNYMDIYFREQLEEAILKYEPTLIFVEHDEYFGERVASRIVLI